MIYTKLSKRAMALAYEAHRGQTDKGGLPYIYHPIHLAEQMDSENAVCVALLHDVVEDTEWTLESLSDEGFPEIVIDALAVLTHDADTEYFDYIEKISVNEIASKVKTADLKHNSDLSRLDDISDETIRQMDKYSAALGILASK